MARTFGIVFLAGILLLPVVVHGQDDDGLSDEFALLEEEIKSDEVESAAKHRQSIFWSPSAITVFTRADIIAAGAASLPDLLRRVPGFDVYELKPSFPLVGARALTDHADNLVLVLVDGREALIELAGFPIWAAMTIDIEEIERVEVIRGPGSTLYGANAFAAVVNITTVSEQPRKIAGDAYLTAGQDGFYRLFGRLLGSWKAAGGVLSASAAVGSGARDSASDREDHLLREGIRFHSYVRYQHAQTLDVSLHGGVLDGGGLLYMIVGDFEAGNVLNHYAMAKASIALIDDLKLKIQLYQIRFKGDFHYRSRFFAFGNWIADIPDFMMDTNTYDGQLQADWRISDWLQLVAGANLRYSYMKSDKVIASGIDELRGALFVNSEWRFIDSLQLTGGFRLDLNSETEPAFSPRVAAVFRPLADQSFRLSYGLAFRKPSFVESQLHMQVDTFNPAFPEVVEKLKSSIGNEDLKNEQVHSIEAGWRGRFLDKALRVSIDLFYNFYLDTVYFESEMSLNALGTPDIMNSAFQFKNNEKRIDAFGGEAELSVAPVKDLRLWANLGLRRVTDSSGARVESEPTLRVNLGAGYQPADGLAADIALHYVSSYTVHLPAMRGAFEKDMQIVQALGDDFLLIGRLGYRLNWKKGRTLEAGLTLRTPLGAPFREYAGLPILEPDSYTVTSSDWAGEKLARLVSFYLRGSF